MLGNSPRRVVFDSHIWFHAARTELDIPHLPNIHNGLDAMHLICKTESFEVALTGANFLEFIKGVREDNFEAEQVKFRSIANVVGGRFVALPYRFVQSDFNMNFSKIDVEDDMYWIHLANCFSEAARWDDVRIEVEHWRRYQKEYTPKWKANAKAMKDAAEKLLQSVVKRHPTLSTSELLDHPTWRRSLWESYLRNYLKRFNICPKFTNVQLHHAICRLKTFSVFASVYESYHSSLFLKNLEPQENDYLDLEQLIYLSDFEFFITDEKRYKTIAGSRDDSVMKNRVISFSEFLERLA